MVGRLNALIPVPVLAGFDPDDAARADDSFGGFFVVTGRPS